MVKGIGENSLFDFSYFLVFLDEMGFFSHVNCKFHVLSAFGYAVIVLFRVLFVLFRVFHRKCRDFFACV